MLGHVSTFWVVTFNGTPITGVEIGQTPDTCWGIGNNFMYRADVTALVPGNGTYTVSNILSALSGPDGQGSSLVVVFTDGADPRTNFISIKDGAVGFIGNGAGAGSTVNVSVLPDRTKVTAINLVADGQPAGDSILYQGVAFGGSDAFVGAEGAMWDTRIDDITNVVQVGASSVQTQVDGSGGDCLAWSMSAIVIENNSLALPPRPAPARPIATTTQTKSLAKPTAPKPARIQGPLRMYRGRVLAQ